MTTQDCQIKQHSDNGIYYREWSVKHAKAIVLLIHGMGEHCQRYNPIAGSLNQAGYTVCSMDLPHHGRSDGKKGHIDSFDLFQQAVLSLYQRVKQSYPDKPLFILGHSMGGLITTRFLINHQDKFEGVILSGPAIEFPELPPKWQVSLITGIAKIFPQAGMIPVDSNLVSRDPAVVEAYNQDPLINSNKLSAKLLVGFMKTMDEVKQKAQVIHLPIMMMHGTADKLTAPSGSQWLHDNIVSQDKTLRLYEGLFHEIFNEPEGEKIYQEVIEWFDQHLPN